MLKKVLAAAVTLGLATGAQAYEPEFPGYIQGSLGQAKAEKPSFVKGEQRGAKELGGNSSSDRTDTAYKLVFGVNVHEYVALEAQYIDLGKAKYKARALTITEKMDLSSKGFGFNVVGNYPITEEFSVFAKTGLHHLKTKAKQKINIPGYGGSKSTNKWVNSIGVGASYEFVSNLAVVGEYERYRKVAKNVKDSDGDKIGLRHNVDLLSVGLRYSF